MVQILIGMIVMLGITYLIGIPLVKYLGFSNIPKTSQRFVFGISALVILMRLPYRENLPIAIGIGASVVIALAGLFILISENFQKNIYKEINSKTVIFSFFLLVVLINPLYPLIVSNALYYYHVGPDLLGHLISAGAILDGKTYYDYMLVAENASNTRQWWLGSTEFWRSVDFRDALNVEFMVRCLRYGHGIISSAISLITKQPIWNGMLSGICFSLYVVALVMFNFLYTKTQKAFSSFLLVLCVCLSHSYILMVHEGIIAQIYCLPLITFLLLYHQELFILPTSGRQNIQLALIISALVSTMSEAIPILLGFTFFGLICYSIFTRYGKESVLEFLKRTCKKLIWISAIVLLISPSIVFDYIAMTVMRSQEGFAYSGFGKFPWDIFSILFSYPYLTISSSTSAIDSLEIFHIRGSVAKVMEICLLLFFGIYGFIYRRQISFYSIIVCVTLIATVALTKVQYPLWKVCVILQPILLFAIYLVTIDRLSEWKRRTIVILYTLLVVVSAFILLNSYEIYASKVKESNFKIAVSEFADGNYVIVTPSFSPLYVTLAASGPFRYADSLWVAPKFSKNIQFPLALYYSCEAEGEKRCSVIQEMSHGKLQPNVLYKTNASVSDIILNNGSIDQGKLANFIISNYGVEYIQK